MSKNLSLFLQNYRYGPYMQWAVGVFLPGQMRFPAENVNSVRLFSIILNSLAAKDSFFMQVCGMEEQYGTN